MYKHVHRVFLTLSKKVRNGVVLNTVGFVNNNFVMPVPAVSIVSLSSLACNIAWRSFSQAWVESESDSDSEDDFAKVNPSVAIQRRFQKEAQENLDDLLANNPELNKFYKIIQLEIEVLRQSGMKIPTTVKPTNWLQLLKLKSQTARRRYLEYIWLIEVKKNSQKLKRKETTLIKKGIQEKELKESNHICYGLLQNSMFRRISKTHISKTLNKKLINAIMFGEKLIIDCGFESQMTHQEISSLSKQIMFSFVANRDSELPFDMHLCNLDPEGELKRRLLSFFPTMDDPGYPLNATSQSYLELFPKEKLVYLSPHTTNIMEGYNPDDVYIVGGIVDKRNSKPLSIAKAKEEGLRVVKFPLDSYLQWKAGSGKNLNVNHCIEIMVDIKHTNSWEYALRAVPTRKIKSCTKYENEPKVERRFTNYEPKFQSAQASHVPDIAYCSQINEKERKG